MYHLLKGYHRNALGLLKRGVLDIHHENGEFKDLFLNETYQAREYKIGAIVSIEIISEYTDTNIVYGAFLPDAGECERIGMPVAPLPNSAPDSSSLSGADSPAAAVNSGGASFPHMQPCNCADCHPTPDYLDAPFNSSGTVL